MSWNDQGMVEPFNSFMSKKKSFIHKCLHKNRMVRKVNVFFSIMIYLQNINVHEYDPWQFYNLSQIVNKYNIQMNNNTHIYIYIFSLFNKKIVLAYSSSNFGT